MIRRGLKYVCNSMMCPFNDRKRQKFVLFDIEHPYICKVGKLVKLIAENQSFVFFYIKNIVFRTILCDGCDLFLNEDVNKRWISGIISI